MRPLGETYKERLEERIAAMKSVVGHMANLSSDVYSEHRDDHPSPHDIAPFRDDETCHTTFEGLSVSRHRVLSESISGMQFEIWVKYFYSMRK